MSKQRTEVIPIEASDKVIQFDRAHLSGKAHGSVEETSNAMLDAEADQLSQARRHERNSGRKDA